MSATATDQPVVHDPEQPLGIESSFPALARLTEEIFHAAATVMIESDGELPGIRYAVVETTAGRDLKDVSSRHQEWRRRVRSLLGSDSRRVRLSVDMQE